MIEKETKSPEKLIHLTASISAALFETFEEEKLKGSEALFILKSLLLLIFDKYDNNKGLAEFFFEDVLKTMGTVKDFKSKGTFTIQ